MEQTELNWQRVSHVCRLVWSLLIALMLVSSPVYPSILAYLEPRALEPGGRLLQPVTLLETHGQRVSLSLGVAPQGAKLVVDDSGELVIDWQSGPDLAQETLLELVATDIDTGERLESRYLLVRRARDPALQAVTPVEPKTEPVPTALSTDVEQPAPAAMPSVATSDATAETAADPDTPSLEPMANQVISAGRVVSLRVAGSIADGTVPVLQVDRLPRNASFDANADGSRTFYWQTGDKDQGEHLFRFSAINPDDTRLRHWHEVLIVVGDPSRNKTLPANPAPLVAE